jgi:hypothetical protein
LGDHFGAVHDFCSLSLCFETFRGARATENYSAAIGVSR